MFQSCSHTAINTVVLKVEIFFPQFNYNGSLHILLVVDKEKYLITI